MEHLLEMDCDVCFIQETFLRDGDKAKLAEIKEYGWNILSDPRKHRSGGGIAMLYKNNIQLKSNTKVTIVSPLSIGPPIWTFYVTRGNLIMLSYSNDVTHS